jgi:hypothetical protein
MRKTVGTVPLPQGNGTSSFAAGYWADRRMTITSRLPRNRPSPGPNSRGALPEGLCPPVGLRPSTEI